MQTLMLQGLFLIEALPKELSAKYITKSTILRIIRKIYFKDNAERNKQADYSPAMFLIRNQTSCG